jgi:hypothetical protein
MIDELLQACVAPRKQDMLFGSSAAAGAWCMVQLVQAVEGFSKCLSILSCACGMPRLLGLLCGSSAPAAGF